MARELRSIGAVSCAKVFGILYAAFGLIAGALFSLLAFLGVASGAFEEAGGALGGALFGVGAVVLFPILYGVFGAIFGLIVSALYNLAAKAIGGIELEIE